jgi:ribonuclease D
MPYLIQATDIQAAIHQLSTYPILWLDIETAEWWTPYPKLSLIQILTNFHDLKGDSVYLLDVLDQPRSVER